MSCGDIPLPKNYAGCSPGTASISFHYNDEPKQKAKIKEIKIAQLDHGYILNVGCKTIALDTPAKILFGLKLYLQNPQKVEEAFERGDFKFEK